MIVGILIILYIFPNENKMLTRLSAESGNILQFLKWSAESLSKATMFTFPQLL